MTLREDFREGVKKEEFSLRSLQRILLPLGGKRVVWLGSEPDLKEIITRGREWNGKGAVLIPGMQNECHANTGWLWSKGKIAKICTGYALSEDGLWRQHSWGLTKQGKIAETTERRVKYFGFILDKTESEKFIYSNPSEYSEEE